MDTYQSLCSIRDELSRLIDSLSGSAHPLFVDRVSDMPVGEAFHPDMVSRGWSDWPMLQDVTGITIHHTMSHSPLATARYCVGTKGYPSVQYHFWVSADDACEAYQLVPTNKAVWHDHTGDHSNGKAALSIGLAGTLNVHKPPVAQIVKASYLVAWLMDTYDVSRGQVRGHCDRAAPGTTVCPGWDSANWRADWDKALDEAVLNAMPEQ